MVIKIKRLLLSVIFLGITMVAFAQPGDPGGDPDVPLGFIEILIAAGALFGAKKWLDRNKET